MYMRMIKNILNLDPAAAMMSNTEAVVLGLVVVISIININILIICYCYRC